MNEARLVPFPAMARPRPHVTLWDRAARPDEEQMREELASQGYLVLRWTCEPATGYPPHVHIYPETLWVVQGNLTVILTAEGRMLELGAGDRVDMPKGITHGTMAGSDGAVYLVATR